MDYQFEARMQVRDYECDLQGIVNNANYLHYTEHTRHLFLRSRGLSFSGLHRDGIDAVVARMSLQYKTPLKSDDEFRSCLNVKKEGLRYVFCHDILRASDDKLCFRGTVDVVCMVGGRLGVSPELDKALGFAEH